MSLVPSTAGRGSRLRAVPALSWHLFRAAGRRGLHAQLLSVGAAAVSTAILLIVLGGLLGAGTRPEHAAWRYPAADPAGTGVQVVSTTFVRGEPVTVVELAQLPGKPATPPPPGLSAFPAPGEVALSPALAELVDQVPADQLGDQFPRPPGYGRIGDAGLAAPDELVAVVGRTATDPAMGDQRASAGFGTSTERAVISGFAGTRIGPQFLADQDLFQVAAALLVVPLLVLATAAGRLGASTRERRLAMLRLANATPRQIIAMTALESAAGGIVGAAAGAIAYGLLLPALAKFRYGIGGWFPAELWVGVPTLLAVVLAVTLLTALSAVSTLRRVATAPLGVAQQSDPKSTRKRRLALFAVIAGACAVVAANGGLSRAMGLALLVVFVASFNIVGPWVVDRLGRVAARFARGPALLLAGRRLSDDPRGAWRTVAGLVLAGFVAGFVSLANFSGIGFSFPGQVAIPMSDATPAAIAAAGQQARELLTAAGVTATVRSSGEDSPLMGEPGVVAEVTGGQDRLDTARTALTGLVPGHPPYTDEDMNLADRLVLRKFKSLSIALLAMNFAIAAASAGLTAAAGTLERRRVYGLLHLAGTPLRVLDGARFRETLIPLTALAGTTTAIGAVIGHQLSKEYGGSLQIGGILMLTGCVAVGTAILFGAISLSRPLLRTVTTQAARTE